MKKPFIFLILVAFILMLAALPAAAVQIPPPPSGQPAAELSEVQKQQIIEIHRQMMEYRKQLVDKYVEFGHLTTEQGKQFKDKIDTKQKYFEQNPGLYNYYPGFGNHRQNHSGSPPMGL